MARRLTQQQVYDDLLTRYGQEIADAFLQAINDLTSRAQVQQVINAIGRGDVDGAISALHLDPAAFGPMLDAIARGYSEGGAATASLLPSRTPDGVALVFRFGARNPRAEAWLREESSALVTRIDDEQRAVIRTVLTKGLERGDNPRTVALDVVGRLDRATGRRVGGVIGLTPQQEAFARNAAEELASGDPAQMRNYLTRELRDRRFDRTIAKAIREETPVPAETIQRALVQYRNRLLKFRGDMIGRTEALSSLNAAQFEALQQAVESGQLRRNQIRRVWRATMDRRTRDTHAVLHGESVGLDEAFTSPSAAVLRYPGDPMAPASERVGCRCHLTVRVDWAANVR